MKRGDEVVAQRVLAGRPAGVASIRASESQSTFAPEAFTTSAHFFVSAAMQLARSRPA